MPRTAVTPAPLADRRRWKRDLAPYLEVDRRRSLGQIASVVVPYLGVWALAAIVRPGAALAVGLGLVATVFLMRMYSLFHDLTHNSLFASRAANQPLGPPARLPALHALPLVAAPAQPPSRAHRQPRQARAGRDLHDDPRRVRARLVAAAARLPRVPQPAAHAVRRAEPRLPVRAPLPAARHVAADPASASWSTNLALAGWAIGWSALVGWQTFLLIQGTTLVAGGAVAAWMLYIQHQYEDTYYRAAGEWRFELAALQGSSYLDAPARRSPGRSATPTTTTCITSARRSRTTACAPRTRSRRCSRRRPWSRSRSSIAALRLKLWDEERACLVRFPARRARPPRRPSRAGTARSRRAELS